MTLAEAGREDENGAPGGWGPSPQIGRQAAAAPLSPSLLSCPIAVHSVKRVDSLSADPSADPPNPKRMWGRRRSSSRAAACKDIVRCYSAPREGGA